MSASPDLTFQAPADEAEFARIASGKGGLIRLMLLAGDGHIEVRTARKIVCDRIDEWKGLSPVYQKNGLPASMF